MTYPNEALELADMTDEAGRLLTAGLPIDRPRVPAQVRLIDREGAPWVAWRGRRRHPAPTGAVDVFRRLDDAKAVRRFVGEFGTIGFCRHGRIAGDAWHRAPDVTARGQVRARRRAQTARDSDPVALLLCGPESITEGDEHWYVEPVSAYVGLAGGARAALAAAADLRRGQLPEATLWAALPHPFLPHPESLTTAKRYLSAVVGWWLSDAGVSLLLDWEQAEPELRFAGSTYARLALELAQAIARADLELCAVCGQLYRRGPRRAKSNQRSYCPDCRGSAAAAFRQRESRSRRARGE